METRLCPQKRYTTKALCQLLGIDQYEIASFRKQGLRIERTKDGLYILGEELIRFIQQKKKACTHPDLH